MSKPDLIIHDEKDNVGVVVIETTKKGQDCNAWIMENDKTINVPSNNEVPLGHKIALKDLKVGDTIFKYGHDIGKVVKEIKKGEPFRRDAMKKPVRVAGIKKEDMRPQKGLN